jgi:hypothetical protein
MQEQKETVAVNTAPVEISNDSLVKLGEHLVGIMGCEDCHSPKVMGPQGPQLVEGKRFGGYPAGQPLAAVNKNEIAKGWAMFSPDLTAAVGPWGVSYARNISSDTTGIGTWTLPQFKKALTEGKLNGGDATRMLLPPMPWTNYKNLSDLEVEAIFTFLQSTQPVKNIVPDVAPLAELK